MTGDAISAEEVRRTAIRMGMPPSAWLILVDPALQEMQLVSASGLVARYPVSTSRFGLGEVRDSYGTPRGFHRIEDRIGRDMPPGTVFKSRKPTGEVLPASAWVAGNGDCILSRIMRLAGMEPGFNSGGVVDSYARYIYIHGTNHEALVGAAPSSNGCIRMRNRDIITLFDRLGDEEAWVWICDPALQ